MTELPEPKLQSMKLITGGEIPLIDTGAPAVDRGLSGSRLNAPVGEMKTLASDEITTKEQMTITNRVTL